MKDKNTKNEKLQITVPLTRRTLKYAVIILLAAALIYTFFVMPEKISEIVSATLSLFSPLIIGLCLAYVVNLLLRPIERFWLFIWRKAKRQKMVSKLKRPVCLILSYVIVLGVIFSIVFMFIPAIKVAVLSFVDKIPQYIENVETWYHATVGFFKKYNFNLPEIALDATKVSTIGTNIIAETVTITTSIVSGVIDLFLGIVFSIYILCQKENLCRQSKKIVKAFVKPGKSEKILDFASLTNKVFTKFVMGQLMEACIIGVLCFIGMKILNMPYAEIVSLLVGFTALVPILGAFIGTGIGALLILLENPIKAFWFVVFIIIIQQIDNNLIYPRIVGKSVGLPGIWVLAAVTIGGGAFGIMGMLFSVPICSVMYVIFRRYVNRKNAELEKDTDEEESETETEIIPEE